MELFVHKADSFCFISSQHMKFIHIIHIIQINNGINIISLMKHQ